MKKLSLIALKRDAEAVTNMLIRLSCVEVSAIPAEESEKIGQPFEQSEKEAELQGKLNRVDAAIPVLESVASGKKPLFARRQPVSFSDMERDTPDFSRALEVAERAARITGRLGELHAEEIQDAAKMASLKPWLRYDMPFSATETKSTELLFGTLPLTRTAEEAAGELNADDGMPDCAIEEVSSDAVCRYVVVLCSTDDDADILPALASIGFIRLDFSGYRETPRREYERLEKAAAARRAEEEALKKEQEELSSELPKLKEASDILQTRLNGLEAQRRMCCTEETAVLSGWVPVGAVKKLEKELQGLTCCYELTDPTEEDDPPTLLVNKKNLDPFEMVIGLYSLPKYGTFDPTFIMSIFYFIIFGLMLADVVYGLILTVGCFLALKLMDLRGGTARLVKLFGICGISCMLAGVLFGSYFGDFITVFQEKMLGIEDPVSLAILFDPVQDPISFLILSLAVGAVHLLVGMGIKAYVLVKTGHPWAALFDVGSWYVLFAGIGLYFLNSTVGVAVAILGALMLICSQGREKKGFFGKLFGGVLSLYDIVNYVADLLSYSRIMALGMSSAVIASVINIISTLQGPTVGGYIMMIVVVIFGNVVNLAINLLGSFVHASRLQYIEFFGKFYESGGRAFDPVVPASRYTALDETNL